MRYCTLALLLLLPAFAWTPAAAEQEAGVLDSPYSLTVFRGHGADVNLREIPGHILDGRIPWEDAWFTGVNFSYAWHQLPSIGLQPLDIRIQGLRVEAEFQLTKHYGLQTNYESHAALGIRTRDLNPLFALEVNFALFNGLSYAMGRPSYEDGPGGGKTGRRYRLQNYIGIEMAVGWLTWPALQIVSRIHHRSGVYGLFAPEGVGSNFSAVGARWRF
jgi:hypothetical protein